MNNTNANKNQNPSCASAHPREQTEQPGQIKRQFDCRIEIRPYKLTRQTTADIERKLQDIAQYEGAHTDFDVCDPQGEVAAVYLFQKAGKLYVRGERYTTILRDPSNLWRLVKRSKRVRHLTLITDRRLESQSTQSQPCPAQI